MQQNAERDKLACGSEARRLMLNTVCLGRAPLKHGSELLAILYVAGSLVKMLAGLQLL